MRKENAMLRKLSLFVLAVSLTALSTFSVAADGSPTESARTASGQPAAAPSQAKVVSIAPSESICGKDADLEDFCFADFLCPAGPECTTNADCGAGERCLVESCCGFNVCATQYGFCSGGGYCLEYQPCTDCQEVVDQNQPSAVSNMAFFSQTDLAQSFEQRLPNVTSGEIFLSAGVGTEDKVTISVWDGLPNAGGTQLTHGGTIARAGEWARVRFAPVRLDPEQPYFLVFESGGTGGLEITGNTSNPYPLGQVYANPGYGSFPNYDYTFRTFAELPIFLDGFEGNSTAAWNHPFACTIAFDDAWADPSFGQGTDPDDYYGPFGVHFNNINGYGVISGEGNGDSGNWDIEGTYGSAAWGIWEGPHAITFDSPVTGVSLDFLRGHNDYSITVNAYLSGGLVGSQTVTVVGPHASEPVAFAGPIDELVLSDTGVIGAGVDNIVYSGMTSCP
jgi:hypothetical protein